MSINKRKKTHINLDLTELPTRCFISHSYKDEAVVKSLLKMLPAHVEPLVFSFHEPDPNQAVSTEIIPKILDCPGLIYLKGGFSAKSFWVSFERDYALRSKRAVFAYDPKRRLLTRDISSPLPLDIVVISHQADKERVERLLAWMADERHFKIDRRTFYSEFGGFTGDIIVIMQELLRYGGVVLWMMGSGSELIARSFYSEDFLEYLQDFGDNLDESPYDDNLDKYRKLYEHVYDVFARIDPMWKLPDFGEESAEVAEFIPRYYYNLIDLYEGLSDPSGFNWNRVDDLIIRLYARILQAKKTAGSGHRY